MSRFKGRSDRRALGGLAGAIILILVVVLLVVGASTATPYIGKQELKPGDYFIYGYSVSDGVDSYEATEIMMVLEVKETEIHIAVVTDGLFPDAYEDNVSYSYDGNVLMMDYDAFVDVSYFPDDVESSYWVSLSGFTPLVVQKYTETGTGSYTLMVKMGTNLMVQMDIKDGPISIKGHLVDTNVMWAKAL